MVSFCGSYFKIYVQKFDFMVFCKSEGFKIIGYGVLNKERYLLSTYLDKNWSSSQTNAKFRLKIVLQEQVKTP